MYRILFTISYCIQFTKTLSTHPKMKQKKKKTTQSTSKIVVPSLYNWNCFHSILSSIIIIDLALSSKHLNRLTTQELSARIASSQLWCISRLLMTFWSATTRFDLTELTTCANKYCIVCVCVCVCYNSHKEFAGQVSWVFLTFLISHSAAFRLFVYWRFMTTAKSNFTASATIKQI